MSAKKREVSLLDAAIVGIDASLIVTALGLMYSLIAYSGFGRGALSFSLFSTTMALIVGGAATMLAGRELSMVSGPTASGALVIGSMIGDLQSIPGAHGSIEAAVLGAAVVVLLTGAAQLLFARLRIGSALKFIPYPVLMGFSNAVALALIVSLIPAALGQDYSGRLMQAAIWFDDWRPGALLVAAAGTAAGLAISRRWPRLPSAFAGLLAATLVHHLIAAGCSNCALGPYLDLGSAATTVVPEPGRAATVPWLSVSYWSAVLQAGMVLAVLNSLFSLLGAAQVTQARDATVNGNRLLRALGIGNLASGAVFGLPVAVVASATFSMRRASTRFGIAMATYLVAVGLVFGLGHRWFEWLPMAAIASAVFITSRGLFDPATLPLLRQMRRGAQARHVTAGPLAVAALVVAVGLLKSLAASLFIGALAAVCLLAIEMRRSVVVAVADARTRRSRRMRCSAELERLQTLGEQIRIVALGHWLYFGTADELGDMLERESSTARWLLLDLHRVAGIDLTAARSLIHAAERCSARGMQIVAAGLPEGDARLRPIELFRTADGYLPLTVVANIDAALERAEDDLLGEVASERRDLPFVFEGMATEDVLLLEPWLQSRSVSAGEVLFRTGDTGDALYVIRHGRLTMWVDRSGSTKQRLHTFGAGGIFGELALLDGRPRSADAVADNDCDLWVLTRDRLQALALAEPQLNAQVLKSLALTLAHRLRDTTTMLDLG